MHEDPLADSNAAAAAAIQRTLDIDFVSVVPVSFQALIMIVCVHAYKNCQ